MTNTWQELTALTQNEEIRIERVKLAKKGISIEGDFELPPIARLTMEDQIFIAAFIKTHGSIKQMEQMFGVSYPTIKNRLNKIGKNFDFVEIEDLPEENETSDRNKKEILDRLNNGNLTFEQAMEELKK